MVTESKKDKLTKREEASAPLWMVTFGDMTILLLTFFIVLLSVAKIEGHELKIILSNFPGLDRLLTGTTFVDGPLAKQSVVFNDSVSTKVETSFDTIEKQFTGLFEFELDKNIVKSTSDERGLVISLASNYFFQRYSAKVNLARTGDILRKVAVLLKEYAHTGKAFRIEGHSDEKNIPLGYGFSDTWELSSARAVSILKTFEKFLVPINNAHIAGYGNTKPFIKEGVDSPFNRRVDIVILDDGNL